jgi:hypothetical protein
MKSKKRIDLGNFFKLKYMGKKELSLGKRRQSVTPTMFLQGAIFPRKKRATSQVEVALGNKFP